MDEAWWSLLCFTKTIQVQTQVEYKLYRSTKQKEKEQQLSDLKEEEGNRKQSETVLFNTMAHTNPIHTKPTETHLTQDMHEYWLANTLLHARSRNVKLRETYLIQDMREHWQANTILHARQRNAKVRQTHLIQNMHQHWPEESSRLARSSLGYTNDVTTAQSCWYSLEGWYQETWAQEPAWSAE